MTAKIVQKSVMHVQSCCFANINLLLFCRSRSRRRRRCLMIHAQIIGGGVQFWFFDEHPRLFHMKILRGCFQKIGSFFLWIELCTRNEGSKIMPSVLCHVPPLDQNGGCEYAVGALMWIVVISLFCPYSLIWKLKKTATALLLLCIQNRP